MGREGGSTSPSRYREAVMWSAATDSPVSPTLVRVHNSVFARSKSVIFSAFREDSCVASFDSNCKHDREMVADSVDRDWLAGEFRGSRTKNPSKQASGYQPFAGFVTRFNCEGVAQADLGLPFTGAFHPIGPSEAVAPPCHPGGHGLLPGSSHSGKESNRRDRERARPCRADKRLQEGPRISELWRTLSRGMCQPRT